MDRLLQEETPAADNQKRTSATIIRKTLEAAETLPDKKSFNETTKEKKKEEDATKEAQQKEAKKDKVEAQRIENETKEKTTPTATETTKTKTKTTTKEKKKTETSTPWWYTVPLQGHMEECVPRRRKSEISNAKRVKNNQVNLFDNMTSFTPTFNQELEQGKLMAAVDLQK